MPAPVSNINAMKFKTPEERRKVMQDYYRHCAQGLSDESFYIDEDTLKRYYRDFLIDFGTIEEVRNKHRLFWEHVGIRGMMGIFKSFNAHTWSFNMKNRGNQLRKNTGRPTKFSEDKIELFRLSRNR